MVKKSILLALVSIAGSCWASQDPTAPLGWTRPATEQAKPKAKQYRLPTLSSIVCKPSAPCLAILNERIVEPGAKLNGYQVASINSEFVTLKRGNRQWKLELFGLNVKK